MPDQNNNLQQDLPLDWGQAELKAETPPAAPAPQDKPETLPPASHTHEPANDQPDLGMSEVPALKPVSQQSVPEPDSKPQARFSLPDNVSSLGVTLLEARSNRNLTAADVATRTRIPIDFIKAIESELYNELPSAVYTKSYIAKLCREYAIDPAPLIRAYQNILPEIDDNNLSGGQFIVTGSSSGDTAPKVEYRLKARPDANQGSGHAHPTRILITILLVAVVILVLTAVAVQQIRNRQPNSQTDELAPPPNTTPTEASTQPTKQPSIDLDQFIIPQQLPLKELQVPND